ncbi:hypothetical protein [Methylobacterium sp. CM6257]
MRILIRLGRAALRRSGLDRTALALICTGLAILALALLLVGLP